MLYKRKNIRCSPKSNALSSKEIWINKIWNTDLKDREQIEPTADVEQEPADHAELLLTE